MRVDGEWAFFDDGVVRPVILGEIGAGDGSWVEVPFLVDTGADRTVLSAVVLWKLGLRPVVSQERLGGMGGFANSVTVETKIQLPRETGDKVVFRGQYAAATEIEALDVCVLGRDITGFFAVIADQPGNLVCLLRQPHSYRVEQG